MHTDFIGKKKWIKIIFTKIRILGNNHFKDVVFRLGAGIWNDKRNKKYYKSTKEGDY